jgi:2-oxoglutarate ferredoxin oxidoreductase subunit alpha
VRSIIPTLYNTAMQQPYGSGAGQPSRRVSVVLAGSGGAGVMTAGNMLLEAAAHAGYYGLMTRSSGPQIRGGEAAAMLRIACHPVECMADRFDVLAAVDWENVQRFSRAIIDYEQK